MGSTDGIGRGPWDEEKKVREAYENLASLGYKFHMSLALWEVPVEVHQAYITLIKGIGGGFAEINRLRRRIVQLEAWLKHEECGDRTMGAIERGDWNV